MTNGQSTLRQQTRYIDNDILNDCDIHTREELQRLADEEGITINWDKWNKLLQKTKFDIQNMLQKIKPRNIYIYTIEGKFISAFSTTSETADFLQIKREQVAIYLRENKPYKKRGIIITNKPIKNNNKKQVPKYVYSIDNKLIGIYTTTREASKNLGIPMEIITKYSRENKPYKHKYIFKDKPIRDNEKKSTN